MSRRFGVATKVHQVVLEDLEAWHQQLDEEYRAHCLYTVKYPVAHFGIRPGVALEVYVVGVGRERRVLWDGYETISATETGAIEAAMLRLASKALLELQGDTHRSEQRGLFA